MRRDRNVREALRLAEQGARGDLTRIVESVPALLRQARTRRLEAEAPGLAAAARSALPRLALATGVGVGLLVGFVLWERSMGPPASFESVLLEGPEADPLTEALLEGERTDG